MRADLYQNPDISVPLNPFPNTWIGSMPGGISISSIITVLFFIVFIIWAIYSIIAVYHWFRYAHHSWLTVPILVLHFFVSGFLLLFMVSGLR